jgi:hypothetical protein
MLVGAMRASLIMSSPTLLPPVRAAPQMRDTQPRICMSGVVERSSQPSEAQDPGPQAWCVGEKVTIADARG